METLLLQGPLWMNAFKIFGTFRSVMLFFLLLLVPLDIQVSGQTCDRSIQIFNSSHALLDGDFLASHCTRHVGHHQYAMVKDLVRDVLIDQALRSLPLLQLSLWLFTDVLCSQELFSSVCQVV